MSIHALNLRSIAYMNIASEGRRLQKIAALLESAMETTPVQEQKNIPTPTEHALADKADTKGSLVNIIA